MSFRFPKDRRSDASDIWERNYARGSARKLTRSEFTIGEEPGWDWSFEVPHPKVGYGYAYHFGWDQYEQQSGIAGAIATPGENVQKLQIDGSLELKGRIPAHLRVAVLWSESNGGPLYQFDDAVLTTPAGEKGMVFRLLVSAPHDEALNFLTKKNKLLARVGCAHIVAFDDMDQSGRFEKDRDVLVGASQDLVVTYLRGTLPTDSATVAHIRSGLGLARLVGAEPPLDELILQDVDPKSRVMIFVPENSKDARLPYLP